MWFGNLVTMAWWDDLWLNESFASWMAEKITNQMTAEFRGESNTQGARAWAMQTDRLLSTSQIYQPVSSNFSQSDQDGGQNPAIVYGKGQVTLAMFETWLGEERFQTGVHRYMAKHAWGNATGEDFVEALVQGDTELTAAFRTFTHQPGIPRVVVALDCSAKPVLTLTQSRFLPQGVHAKDTPLWAVPVTVRTPAGTSQILLKTQTAKLSLQDASCPPWVLANASGSGYYRVVYAPGALRTLLMSADLSQPELMASLNDALALTESGDMPVAETLELATHFATHPQRELADAALNLIGRMDALIEPADRSAYAALWQRAFGQRGRALGLLEKPGDSPDDRLMRSSWVGRLADAGHDTILRSDASHLAHNWLADRNSIGVNSRGLVLRTAALTGDRAFFDALMAALAGNPDRHARADIYAALGNFRDPELTKAARQLWLSPEHDIREVALAGRSGGSTNASREEWFQFLTNNFETLVARVAQETTTRFPQMFAGACSEQQANKVEAFFTPLLTRFDGMAKTLRQSMETVRLCANYRDAQLASLQGFLGQFRAVR
jgi:alanyl aminopeptidase